VPEEILRKKFETLMNNGSDTFKYGSIGFSMFERAWTLRGMENLLTDMILEPDFVDELLDRICDYNMKIVDIGLEYDIDGFYFGDDWGQQSGLIMGPKHWRRFIKPRMARMYEKVRNSGKFVLQHSCGDIHEIFPDLIEIGLNAYQTFQPEIYNIDEIKKVYGSNLTFWGGISTQKLLPFGTPGEVKKETVRIMKILGQNGGYIAAPTHAVPGDVPVENMLMLIEIFQNQHKYL
jgi:uroporphyrinogen decarboxylase